ncbi:MAG: hypothetical protein IPM03_01825 [Sulfuritalea sp.]|nr:hypothetical protein [Sulfuritalea sp.]
MAKDVTIRVTGTNPDGTINVQMPDGGNPFLGGGTQQTGLVLANQSTQAVQTGGYRARVGNADVMFASEADFLKADKAWRDAMQEQGTTPTLGGGGGRGGGGGLSWLRTGADAAEAVAAFLQGRNVRRTLDELQDALDDSKAARAELETLSNSTKYAELIPILKKCLIAERNATEASTALLEDQLTAIDIQTGAGVARVAGDLYEGYSGRGGAGGGDSTGSLFAVGAAGLGLGLLFSNNRDNNSRSRRRR